MSHNVNMDALVRRADMESGEYKPLHRLRGGLNHHELEHGKSTYALLRKPDFQRETSSWTPDKVRDMVIAYINGELVPSIILWRSPTNDLFVIDGAHRLSCIIAWVNDDYGDGLLSEAFFANIPERQREAAQETRELIAAAVGSYKTLSTVLGQNSEMIAPRYIENAKLLVHATIQVQELETGDARKAERSFFKINEQGVVLSDTEKWILHSRRCPNSIAARAVNQQATGHPHWKGFTPENITALEELSKEIYNLIFLPVLPPGTLKTSDVPIGGPYSVSSALGLLFNAINMANNVGGKIPSSSEDAEAAVGIDVDGAKTIEYLKKTRRSIAMLSNSSTSNFMHSLDLHPFVYFYSERGKHQPSVFLSVVEWIKQYDETDAVLKFIPLRRAFEDFLLSHRYLIPQISRKVRGEIKAVHRIKDYFSFVVDLLDAGATDIAILDAVSKEFGVTPVDDTDPENPGKNFSVATKSSLFVQDELFVYGKTCYLCGARVAHRSISFDHLHKRSDGGLGEKTNAGLTHHFCNSSRDKLEPLLKKRGLLG